MAQISVVRLPLPQDEFKREQQDVLIRELESLIDQLNFSYQDVEINSQQGAVWNIMADRYLNKGDLTITARQIYILCLRLS